MPMTFANYYWLGYKKKTGNQDTKRLASGQIHMLP